MQNVILKWICFQVQLSVWEKSLESPTPYNEFAFHMLKALEEKNDGMFDYE